MEYLGVAKGKTYIISKDSGEACSFSSFGEFCDMMSDVSAIASCSYLKPIELVSIVGDPSVEMCEILFKGYTALVGGSCSRVYFALRDPILCESALAMRVSHIEEYAIQMVIPFRVGVIDRDYIEGRLGTKLDWSEL